MYHAYGSAGVWQRLELCMAFLPPMVINAVDIQDIHGAAPGYAGCGTAPDCVLRAGAWKVVA
jgi:hypothetical protein